MKTTVKAILTATALSTAGLCLSISQPATAMPKNVDYNLVIVNKYSSVSSRDGDFSSNTDLFTTETFAQIFDKPLVKIPLDNTPVYPSNRITKSTDFFALATVFNDKLQQLIAKITQSSPSYSVNEKGEMALSKVASQTCNAKSKT